MYYDGQRDKELNKPWLMKRDWDGYGAEPISKNTLIAAMTLFTRLPASLPKPEVSPEPDGEIALEWYGENGGVFSISVNENKQLNFSGLFTDNSKVHGKDKIDSFDKEIYTKYIHKAIG